MKGLSIEVEEEEIAEDGLSRTSFRQDGLSIGVDYLRLDGKTLTRSSSMVEVGEEIGRGAFSIVKQGIWSDGSVVAVKESSVTTVSPQRRDMLVQELKILGSLQHECIVGLRGAYLQDNSIVTIMEYMDRGSLEELIHGSSRRILSNDAIAAIAWQLLSGVAYLHERRILHRDLKPANVLLNSAGSVKLCDWGLATLSESLNTTMLGTYVYLAPERLRSHECTYGRPSDVWSCGLIFLECATLERPWSNVSSIVDLVVTLNEAAESAQVHPVPSTVTDPGLGELLQGCLAYNPGTRWWRGT